MKLPTSLDQLLQRQIVCACLDIFLPVGDLFLLHECESLVTCKSQRHFKTFCWQSFHEKAVEMQITANRNNMKGFYNGLKESVGTQEEGTCSHEINR